ncbi:hypothetical protein [Bacillus thuringiensis]|uniref:hypothetical protein n=1 Tax=Bacillus thuringiensis TaxID=1428 RepID=UPI001CC8F024|nr:hypothetical protein [Bacillus thuringiensis]
MIKINIFKASIFDPDLQKMNRSALQRKGTIIDNIIQTGNRKTVNRNGYIFRDTSIIQNNSKQEVNYPRQEPLEHSWKRLNT